MVLPELGPTFDTVEDLKELLDDISKVPAHMTFLEDDSNQNIKSDLRCHICSNYLETGFGGWVYFGDESKRLPVHRQCHLARVGMSSEGIMLSLKVGRWMLNETLCFETGPKWLHSVLSSFVSDCGSGIGKVLIGGEVEWWDAERGVQVVDELVRLTRHLYIYEREAPKFETLGGCVPEWDETSMSWEEYKRNRPILGPFYRTLKDLQKKSSPLKRVSQNESLIAARTGGCCAFCGGLEHSHEATVERTFSIEGDHILPLSKGGSNDLSNFQPLHKFCNRAKSSFSGGHMPLAIKMGRWFIDSIIRPVPSKWVQSASNGAKQIPRSVIWNISSSVPIKQSGSV